MMKVFAAFALVGLIACATEKKAVGDDAAATLPKAECCTKGSGDCGDAAAKANCSAEKKAGCSASASACTAKPQG